MPELDQGQCEGFCQMCDIKGCHFKGVTNDLNGYKLDIALDNLLERIIREEGEE